jgi:transcriptional regulator with XRE-family HTH domain
VLLEMNHTQLGAQVKAKREREGLSLAQAARIVNVSASTLCRIERGIGDAIAGDNLTRILNWTGYVPEGAIQTRITEPLPDMVGGILANDAKLHGESAARLTVFFRKAYEAATGA